MTLFFKCYIKTATTYMIFCSVTQFRHINNLDQATMFGHLYKYLEHTIKFGPFKYFE